MDSREGHTARSRDDSSDTIDNLAHLSVPTGQVLPLDRGRWRWSELNVLLSGVSTYQDFLNDEPEDLLTIQYVETFVD